MKVIRNERGVARLRDGLDSAHDASLSAFRADAAALVNTRTGEYASTLRATRDGDHGGVYSPLPQGGAVERGANVGPRRGPHMAGGHAIRRAAAGWAGHMSAALRRS